MTLSRDKTVAIEVDRLIQPPTGYFPRFQCPIDVVQLRLQLLQPEGAFFARQPSKVEPLIRPVLD